MKQYKYLVVAGCSQTYGQGCYSYEIYPQLLADKLKLQLINLATSGTGWYSVEANIMSFIKNNKNILNECFFILQISQLERRLNYEELPICRTDVWEKWNIKYMSPVDMSVQGYNDWEKYGENKPSWWLHASQKQYKSTQWCTIESTNRNLIKFPEHKHYSNSLHHWKLGKNHSIQPPYIQEQFEELMSHWGLRISSLHLFLKNLNIDHIIVDGYSPLLSYKLNFTNYYDTNDEYEMVKEFWSTNTIGIDVDDVMIYDFKNIQVGWIFDSIDIKYKIDDVVLWSLYQFKPHQTEWNIDGGHAGPLGMKLIADTVYKSLVNKGWIS